jgi:hypothetical protein
LGLDSQPKSVLEIAAKHYAQATRGRYVRSGRDPFGFGRDRQAERRFQEELRLDCRSRSLPAFDKRCSASVVFLANFDSKYRSCAGLMVAVNKIGKMPRKMNVGLLTARAVLRYWSCCSASSSMTCHLRRCASRGGLLAAGHRLLRLPSFLEPCPPGPSGLLWNTRRRFDPSSSPSANTSEPPLSPWAGRPQFPQ